VKCLTRFLTGSLWGRCLSVAITLKFLFVGSSALHGQVVVVPMTSWLGTPGTTGDWFLGRNWNNGIPTASLNTIVDNGGTAQVGAPGGAQALSLSVGRTVAGSMVQLVTGGSLSVGSGNVFVGTGGTLRFSGSFTNGTISASSVQNNGTIVFDGPLAHAWGITTTGAGNFIMNGTGTLAVNSKIGDAPNVQANAGIMTNQFQ
jgi:hypothetical protein